MALWKYDLRGKALLFAITATSCQAFLLLGYDQGEYSLRIDFRPLIRPIILLVCSYTIYKLTVLGALAVIIGPDTKFAKDFGYPDPSMQGNITALYIVGCVLGSIFCYFVAERMGRRAMLIIGGGAMAVGAAVQGSSHTIIQLIAGRIVMGLGNGINVSTAPLLISECSPASIRGALMTMQGTVTVLGVLVAYWTSYGTSFCQSSFQWRFPLAFQAIFAVFLILQTIGLPETPRWLLAHDRHDEASLVIAAIAGKPSNDPSVKRTISSIQKSLDKENQDGPFHFRELFTWGLTQNFRRLLLAISVQLAQQFSGSNMINYYSPLLFQRSVNLDRNSSLLLGGGAQCTYLLGSMIPVLLMDRYGRRFLLIVCSTGLSFCFIMITAMLYLGTRASEYSSIVFIYIFQLIRGIGWLPVPWFYPSELATPRIRSRMQSIASAWNWLAAFAVVKLTPVSIASIHWRTFIIFAVLNMAFIPMIFFFYPETKGLELEDAPFLFYGGGITGGVFASGRRTLKTGECANDKQNVRSGDCTVNPAQSNV